MNEFEEPPNKPNRRAVRGPISISFLFYLITLAAILSACLRTLVIGEAVTGQLLMRAIFIGIATGLVAGALAGVFYFRGGYAIVVGTIAGTATGACAGALSLIQIDRYTQIVWVAFAGCWLLIVALLLTARFQKQVNL